MFYSMEPAVLTGRIFGLDAQLLFDLGIQAIAVFILFFAVGYILINPVRKALEARQEKVKSNLANAAKDREDAAKTKAEYDEKLARVDEEAKEILSEARHRAVKNEADIVAEAKEEAGRIISNAGREAELEKAKVKDEVRLEIINVATLVAGKFVEEEMDSAKQEQLLKETLEEIGEDTWQN